MPVSARIPPVRGPTEVSAARRLAPAITMPVTSSPVRRSDGLPTSVTAPRPPTDELPGAPEVLRPRREGLLCSLDRPPLRASVRSAPNRRRSGVTVRYYFAIAVANSKSLGTPIAFLLFDRLA